MQQSLYDSATTIRATPPWQLTGSGWVALYRFPRAFVRDYGLIPEHLAGKFRGGIGAVMMLDYRTSPVGPYRELLFIPGVFRHGRRKYYAVTKIYVSSLDSVVNGRENWGIPKQLAEFDITTEKNVAQRFEVAVNGELFFSATMESGVLRFPVNTRVNPFPPTLLQQHADDRLLTIKPQLGGTMSVTGAVTEMAVAGRHFPDVSAFKPAGLLELVNMRLYFPIPKVIS
ncbi:MAG: acetoacetate decarboxylase family protein [Chloroflexota bacterium]